MALSVVDLYSRVLPKTNCKDCGFQTCLAFAGMVVSEKHPLKNCPHIPEEILKQAQPELEQQYKEGKWLKKDMAQEALSYAKERAASMKLADISERIGGSLETGQGQETIVLPYFNKTVHITSDQVVNADGRPLSRNEQTFVFIHMAQGGTSAPTGKGKSFKEFPNTVSKIVSMKNQVEVPLSEFFGGKGELLKDRAARIGGKDVSQDHPACDLAFLFHAFPKVPVTLLFWDGNEGFDAEIKLMFDETVIQHMDIESIMFLSEYLTASLIS